MHCKANKLMNILSVETVLGKCSVALQYKNRKDFLISTEDFTQSEMLFVLIEELLIKHQIAYDDLNFISCTTGPGSFAGIRAGITAISTIQILKPHITALGINTMEVLAFAALPIASTPAAAVIRHGNKFYLGKIDCNGKIIDTITNTESFDSYKTIITTEQALQLKSNVKIKTVALDASIVLDLTKQIIEAGTTALYNSLSPLYVGEPTITK